MSFRMLEVTESEILYSVLDPGGRNDSALERNRYSCMYGLIVVT